MPIILCSYCLAAAELIKGDVLYPSRPDLHRKSFWRCVPCKAWVGCHAGTETPLGRLADYTLRRAKSAAHTAFDPLWREGHMGRSAAYTWLAITLGRRISETHIGLFDVETCWRVVALCNQFRREL